MMFKRLVIVLSFWLGVACADEINIPKFDGEIVRYLNPSGGEIRLGERTLEQVTFWFRTLGGNNHQCQMAGIGKSRDGETYRYSQIESSVHCSLSIIVLNDAVVLIDNANQCKKISCGQRAAINGTVFRQEK